MAKSSLTEMRGLPDPLQAYKFDLIISGMPVGSMQALKLRCRSTQIPGLTLEDSKIQAHGVDLGYAGRTVFEQNQTAQFFETRDMAVRDSIRPWMDFCTNTVQNTGEYKVNYEATADIVLYDQRNNVIRTIRLFGFFPKQLDSPSTGSDSTPVEYSCTFHYDYHVDL